MFISVDIDLTMKFLSLFSLSFSTAESNNKAQEGGAWADGSLSDKKTSIYATTSRSKVSRAGSPLTPSHHPDVV